MVRWATLVLLSLVACSDLREFRGTWSGKLNDNAPVVAGIPATDASMLARLTIAEATNHDRPARSVFDYAQVATMRRAAAMGVSANRITLLRDTDGDGVAETR